MITIRVSLIVLLATLSMAVFADGLVGSSAIEYDNRVEKTLKKLDIDYEILKNGRFKLFFSVDDTRSQVIFINSVTQKYRDFEIREIWAIGYKSPGEQFSAYIANQLLENTAQNKLGAWSKEGEYALYTSRISADADAESLRSTLKLVLEVADTMEANLTEGKDEF